LFLVYIETAAISAVSFWVCTQLAHVKTWTLVTMYHPLQGYMDILQPSALGAITKTDIGPASWFPVDVFFKMIFKCYSSFCYFLQHPSKQKQDHLHRHAASAMATYSIGSKAAMGPPQSSLNKPNSALKSQLSVAEIGEWMSEHGLDGPGSPKVATIASMAGDQYDCTSI
jgi:hypothetical protein